MSSRWLRGVSRASNFFRSFSNGSKASSVRGGVVTPLGGKLSFSPLPEVYPFDCRILKRSKDPSPIVIATKAVELLHNVASPPPAEDGNPRRVVLVFWFRSRVTAAIEQSYWPSVVAAVAVDEMMKDPVVARNVHCVAVDTWYAYSDEPRQAWAFDKAAIGNTTEEELSRLEALFPSPEPRSAELPLFVWYVDGPLLTRAIGREVMSPCFSCFFSLKYYTIPEVLYVCVFTPGVPVRTEKAPPLSELSKMTAEVVTAAARDV